MEDTLSLSMKNTRILSTLIPLITRKITTVTKILTTTVETLPSKQNI
jgi:hypothetical protein